MIRTLRRVSAERLQSLFEPELRSIHKGASDFGDTKDGKQEMVAFREVFRELS